MKNVPQLIRKISEATLSFYETDENKEELLEKVKVLIEFLNDNPEVEAFFKNFSLDIAAKRDILDNILNKLGFDIIFFNTSHLLLDKNLIFHFLLFLNNLQESIYNFFKIQNVYIYSSTDLDADQKKRLETAWNKKLDKNCIFHYLLDPALKMGIKIQIENYIEEYSIGSQLEKLKGDLLKFLD